MRAPDMRTALACLLVSLAASAESAKDLNTQGFRLYKQKKYGEALELFRKAMQADDKLALAHYNYAATLGVLRKQGKVCDFDAYKSEILDHLEKSIALDAGRKKRAVADADFEPVRDTVRYQKKVLGKDPAKPGDVKAILEAVTFYGPMGGLGIYGSVLGVDFQPGGKLSVWRKVDLEEGAPKKKTVTGTWTLEGTKVRVQLSEPLQGESKAEGDFTSEGLLEMNLGGVQGPLVDEPSECDA
jgi:tetratricopeptide (TPR) repeat protein